jgi:GNAT superfamily N-acetyltransferase
VTGDASAYEVRPARRGDLPGVLRLQSPSRALGSDQISETQQLTWAQMLGTDGMTVYVAVAGEEVVGTATLLVMPNLGYDCHPSALVEAMVVAVSHRRGGVGRMLVTRLLSDARAASCRKVQLLSHKRHAHDGAHAFYRSLGFAPEAEGFRLYLDP